MGEKKIPFGLIHESYDIFILQVGSTSNWLGLVLPPGVRLETTSGRRWILYQNDKYAAELLTTTEIYSLERDKEEKKILSANYNYRLATAFLQLDNRLAVPNWSQKLFNHRPGGG